MVLYLLSMVGRPSNITIQRPRTIRFDIGTIQALEVTRVCVPVGDVCLFFNMYVVDTNDVILVCSHDMDSMAFYLNNLGDKLVPPPAPLPPSHLEQMGRF